MGILGLVFDGFLVSTGIAAVRRFTGFNTMAMIEKRISNPTARSFLGGYLNIGEKTLTWTADRAKAFMSSSAVKKIEQNTNKS